MEDYAGRILADRYRLPLPPTDEYELVETRAFDTRSGQEVLVRQVPLPEVVDAELLDGHRAPAAGRRSAADLPAVRRAIEAAQAAAAVPDHPRLDQVFDVFAEGGSLWIVSELVPARPLAALIADEPLTPYRAAEVASDVLTALRVLHAHGWTHRNITVRTVLVCDDGRVVLTGLAAGAAEDALCGYDPVPDSASPGGAGWDAPEPSGGQALAFGYGPEESYGHQLGPGPGPEFGAAGTEPGPGQGPGPEFGAPRTEPGLAPGPGPELGAAGTEPGPGLGFGAPGVEPGLAPNGPGLEFGVRGVEPGPGQGPGPEFGVPAVEPGLGQGYAPGPADAPLVAPGYDTGPRYRDHITPERPGERPGERPDAKAAARAGAIAAYRAGARAAAARVSEERKAGAGPAPEPRPEGSTLPQGYSYPYGGPQGGGTTPWHGTTPRRQALPAAHRPGQEPPAPAQGGAQAESQLHPQQGPQSPHRPPEPRPHAQQTPQSPPWPQPQPESQPPARPQPPSPSARAVLPAQLALPQGYRQAEAEAEAEYADQAARPGARPARQPLGDGWGGGGPRTGLDAERARQTRMAVVGAVTERWAPEQARPVTGPWQLAAPVGPATDLWALGALLYRAVQGHAPYPEDSVAELVDMVCSEPPAFAEECGALRPVVESLLRQDPTERPEFEELRGWLRSLVRSAPEPETGFAALPMPEPDPARLPVVRRRGELHGRHRNPAAPRKPRALGRTLLAGILVLLAGAVAYAMLFMPRAPSEGEGGEARTPATQGPAGTPGASANTPTGTPESKPAPQTTTPPASPAAPAPAGYTSQQDPEHFEIAVPDGWERRGINEAGQVRYTSGQFALTVVPGRDKVEGNPDPAAYQKDKEQELTPYRTSTWSTVSEVKSTKVGQQLRATGKYTWIDGNGSSVVARNYVVALGGSYHVVVVTGPQDDEAKVTEVFEKATASYRAGG
ncbi:protein kinase [Streptomyces sp. NPDC048255]|uniref:protein kinase n=1 Tax=Streptomyces sp. NPDC048255 TaxID=3154713 RepID=UPI0033E581B6